MIMQVLDTIKKGLTNRNVSDIAVQEDVLHALEANPIVSQHDAVRPLLADLHYNIANQQVLPMTHTKAWINMPDNDCFVSLFDANYFPSLSLDGLTYRTLPEPVEIAASMPSPTKLIWKDSFTSGFAAREVVALFPENHIDHIQLATDKIFYFIDEFASRFGRITQKMLPLVQGLPCPDLLSLDEQGAAEMVRYWVWLHEYFHRQGPMPVPKYLRYKSTRALAGLEELRADMSTIEFCCSDRCPIAPAKAERLASFILAERLLRYAVEGLVRPNYDAVASQVLFSYCLSEGAVKLHDKLMMSWSDDIFDVVIAFKHRIHEIEQGINYLMPEQVAANLVQFMEGCKPAGSLFEHSVYFSQVKDWLAE